MSLPTFLLRHLHKTSVTFCGGCPGYHGQAWPITGPRFLGPTHGAPGSQPPSPPPIPLPCALPSDPPPIHHLSHPLLSSSPYSCRLPPVLGGRPAPFPLPSYLVGCLFPGGNRFETFRVSVWGRCKGGLPTPTSGGAHSPEVIVSRRFAFRVARLLLSAYRFLAFPPWEVAARFLPCFPAGFLLAGFLSLPLLLLLLLLLVARFLPFLARPFFFAVFWLLLLPLLLLLMLLLPLVLLLSLLLPLLPLSLSLSLSLWLLLLLCG